MLGPISDSSATWGVCATEVQISSHLVFLCPTWAMKVAEGQTDGPGPIMGGITQYFAR